MDSSAEFKVSMDVVRKYDRVQWCCDRRMAVVWNNPPRSRLFKCMRCKRAYLRLLSKPNRNWRSP